MGWLWDDSAIFWQCVCTVLAMFSVCLGYVLGKLGVGGRSPVRIDCTDYAHMVLSQVTKKNAKSAVLHARHPATLKRIVLSFSILKGAAVQK